MPFVIVASLIWITTTTAIGKTTLLATADQSPDYLPYDSFYGDISTLNSEGDSENLDEDTFNEMLPADAENGTVLFRTLGLVESNGNSHLREASTIMAMFSRYNVSYTGVSLPDYSSDDAYSFRKVVKALKELNPNAVIGPYNWPYAVASEHLRIPYFVTSQMPFDQKVSPFLIRLFPEPEVFATATEDILRYYSLDKVAVFYDCAAGDIILERLCQQPLMEVTGFFVNNNSISNIREQLKIVRSKYFTTFIGVLSARNIHYFLEQALSLSMFSSPFKWLLVNMNLQEYSLQKYTDSRANLTVLRLMVDSSSNSCALGSDYITMRRALFHDAVRLHVHIDNSDVLRLQNHSSVNMRRIIRTLEIDGCTGHFKFTRNATRSESFLQMITLEGYKSGSITDEDNKSFRTVYGWREQLFTPADWMQWLRTWSGTWRSLPDELTRRVEPSKSFSSVIRLSENVFGEKPLRITIKEETPFVQARTDHSMYDHDLDFEGFLVDILLEMAKLLGFTFKMSKVPDGKFGSRKEDGWTGMIRQLIDDKADIALAPFQMTTERAEVVDFTKPFMTKGTTVVVRRPEPKIGTFQFLFPFSNIVWCAIFVAFVSASLTLFAVSRVNSDRQAKYTHNLRESFWYMWGTLLRGSLCGSPRAISSRIISSAWWFFCLILSSVYTANLAAFLTITISDVGINTAQDLALQDTFDYGTVEDSQTATFFNHTRMNLYSRMWAHMSVLSPKSMSRDTVVGFERVKKGNYAFIWDSPIIRHKISNDCDLMEIGSPFDLKGYGFAHRKEALYGDKLSWALLKLQDDGVLYKLERKWWPPQFCPSPSAKTESLDLETVAGMYLVIFGGAIISSLMCLLQYCYNRRRLRLKSRALKLKEGESSLAHVLGEEFQQQSYWKKPEDGDELHEPNQDTITYANHSPLHFMSVDEWT